MELQVGRRGVTRTDESHPAQERLEGRERNVTAREARLGPPLPYVSTVHTLPVRGSQMLTAHASS